MRRKKIKMTNFPGMLIKLNLNAGRRKHLSISYIYFFSVSKTHEMTWSDRFTCHFRTDFPNLLELAWSGRKGGKKGWYKHSSLARLGPQRPMTLVTMLKWVGTQMPTMTLTQVGPWTSTAKLTWVGPWIPTMLTAMLTWLGQWMPMTMLTWVGPWTPTMLVTMRAQVGLCAGQPLMRPNGQ